MTHNGTIDGPRETVPEQEYFLMARVVNVYSDITETSAPVSILNLSQRLLTMLSTFKSFLHLLKTLLYLPKDPPSML